MLQEVRVAESLTVIAHLRAKPGQESRVRQILQDFQSFRKVAGEVLAGPVEITKWQAVI
jgi:hypothetical protein